MAADDTKRPHLPRIASYNPTNGRSTSAYAPITGERCTVEGQDCTP
jgi:hypothetical protein